MTSLNSGVAAARPGKSRSRRVVGWCALFLLALGLDARAVAAVGEGSAVRVTRLRCEALREPQGIDVPMPRLSWVLESEGRGQRQTACQVLVATDPSRLREGEADLWDSGRRETWASVHFGYGGRPLPSRARCYWKVRVWDGEGRASAWSETASFSVGLLRPEDWKARWIGRDEPPPSPVATPLTVAGAKWIWAPGEDGARAAPTGTRYFRRTFELPAEREVARAELLLAADNEFATAVNAQHAGAGSNFKTATAMEVTRSLRPGRNVVAAWVRNHGESANPAGLLGSLRVEFADGGAPLVLPTDSRWIVHDRDVPGWTGIDFDESGWRKAEVLGAPGMAPWGDVAVGDEDRRLPARMLRREFVVERPVRRATVYFSGLGLSELYLNGVKVGDHVLSPALSEYPKRVFYLAFDVTGLLRPGPNALGAWLGNGRYFAPRGGVPTGTATYGFPKLLLQLEVDYADGTRETVVSDATWKLTTEGPILANNEYDGEEYDARREQAGWDRPGFDDARWQPASLVAAPAGRLCAPMIEPIRVTESLKPRAVTEPKPGVFVYDLGQNLVGWCRLEVRGPAGVSVRLRHAETLKPDGTLYLENLRGAKVTDVYTLRGQGTEVYEPRFTYHGFRYVELTGYPGGKPPLDAIQGRVVHDDVASAGTWECSNPMLNRILANVRWGVRGNYRSIPTDCPQRDERQGWLGDRSAECRGESYLFDIEALYAKWVQDMEDAQKESGSVPDVCPSYWPIYSDNVTWPSSLVIIPGMLRDQYDDRTPVARRYGAMRRWVDYLSGFVTNGLIARDTYGDWCVPPEDPKLIHSADPLRKTHPEILASGYFVHVLQLLSGYARELGKSEDAERYATQAVRMREALHRKHYRADLGWYDNGSQTACVLPLAFGLVPAPEVPRVFARLQDKIVNETRLHVGTGLIGGQWLMRTLSDQGRDDLAFTLASQETYPSWGYMVARGATTIWELWNGDTADPAMNSGNHVMLVGDLVIWMYERLAGIAPDPARPGFKHIVMRPRPVDGLAWVKAMHRSPLGDIGSHWRRQGTRFAWDVTVPANATATVHLPARAGAVATESGRPLESAPGVLRAARGANEVVAELGSGTYRFVVE
jgi:alpha-L-rhamnosidase